METLREKIKNNKQICGTLVAMGEPSVCEMIGHLGYDFIWVDMEHGYISCKDVFIHANAARAANTPVIIRLPQNDLTVTKRVLDMGVEGVIFPMVQSAEEMETLLSYTLYPPYGCRGFGPQRAIRYSLDDPWEYTEKGHLETLRFIQIEHFNAVKEIERIAENPYLDGIIFGPNDLSGSINQLGKVYDPDTTKLIEDTIKVMKKHNKAIGVATGSTDEKVLKHWHDMGITMITSGADYSFLQLGALETLKTLKNIQK